MEILVHIRAPSRAIDDARYRSLATAYLAFEPTISTRFLSESEDGRNSSRSSPVDGHGPTSQMFQTRGADEGESYIMLSDERLGSFRSPQASFKSVVDNARSPRLHIRQQESIQHNSLQKTPMSATQAAQASWESPPSIVQDSHPMNQTSFASLTSPTRVLENYLQHFESPSESSRHASQASVLAAPHEQDAQETGRQIHKNDMIPCTPQMIPRTPRNMGLPELPSDGIDKSGRRNSSQQQQQQQQQQHLNPESDRLSDDHIIEETTLLSSPQPLAGDRADAEPPPEQHQLRSLASTSGALARTTSDVGPRSLSPNKAPVAITFLSTHGFTYESLEIRPPESATSDLHIKPEELITPGLYRLGRDVDISLRFRPKEQTRELRPYERGYWLLDCSSWEPRLKRAAWAFLANYIGVGIAGWGVWCKRDPEFTELRAYCWGSVAAHIYYVLWMSSQREIKFTGSSWIDGEGSAVIVMGPGHHTQT